jgi:hypothetical protein
MDFVKRMKFWIGVGLLVLVSGVVFGVWFLPARARSGRGAASWREKVQGVESMATPQGLEQLHSEADVQSAEQVKEQLEQQLSRAKEMVAEQDRLLEDHIPDPDTGECVTREGGAWKLIYGKQMENLEADIRKSFVVAPTGLVRAKSYGDAWPGEEEMKTESKNYWVQRYVLEALAAANSKRMVVPILNGFRLVDKPDRLLHPTHATMYQLHPFEIQIATEFPSIPFVLEQLLKCKVGVAVTGLDVERRERLAAAASPGVRGPAGPAVAPRVGPPAGVPTGPPAGVQLGPPPGIRMGPPPGTRMGPPPGIRMGPSFAPSAPTGGSRVATGGRWTATTAPARQPAQAAAAPSGAAAEALAGALVNVTIRGYVLDYVAPAAGKTK